MAEFRLNLELDRASGVLASIVASLARQGLELKNQKLTRASEGRGGTLVIVADGEIDDIAGLAEQMGSARGVGRVDEIHRDGEPVFARGAVIEPVVDVEQGADAADVEAELDDFLKPEDEPDPADDATSNDAPVDDDRPEGWLETDPDADKPPALHPRATDPVDGDDEGGEMLGRRDDPDPGPEATPEPEPDAADDVEPATSGSGWGKDNEDEWESSIEAAIDDGADASVDDPDREQDLADDRDRDDGPDGDRDRERDPADESGSKAASDSTARPADKDDGNSPKGGKPGVEGTLRRRRRRRR